MDFQFVAKIKTKMQELIQNKGNEIWGRGARIFRDSAGTALWFM